MKRVLFCLLIPVLAGAGTLGSVDAPGSGLIRVDVAPDDRVKVTSDYWRLEFDLRNGGVLDTIVFPHGSGSNLLLQPFRTYVDGWSDENAPSVEFRQEKEGSVVRLEFSGKLAGAGRVAGPVEFRQEKDGGVVRLEFSGNLAGAGRVAGPVEFRTTWTLSGFVVRADHQLRFPEEMSVRTVGVGSTAVRREMDEYGVRVGPTDDP
ncbi:MAG: hypothetical protein GY953_21560, partial [bacterium]|nr:hypothetical protein [bacterium]